MLKGDIYVVIDGQAGSCGKGKFVGFLARHKHVDISINNNTPNAGHTFVFDDGRKVVTHHLPIAVVGPNVRLFIGAGAVINPDILKKELNEYADIIGDRKIYIHERAGIVTQEHILYEQQNIKSGSTFQGTAAATVDKILRKPGTVLAKDYNWNNDKIIIYDDSLVIRMFEENLSFLVETSQGFDLDINHGLKYPYTTSRQCNVMQSLADIGIPNTAKVISYMIFRPYPIRISNQTNRGEIYSGDYGNSKEITWEEICQRSGLTNIHEYTTVTKKIRRVFEFEWERFHHAVSMNNPTYLVLNFAQYLDGKVQGFTQDYTIDLLDSPKVEEFINKIVKTYKKDIAYVGTGPKDSEYVDMLVDKYKKGQGVIDYYNNPKNKVYSKKSIYNNTKGISILVG